MGINSTEVAYGFGQLGSAFNDGTSAMTPPTGKVFVAITMLTDVTFDSSGGLKADNDVANGLEFINTEGAAHDAALSPDLGESGTGGIEIDVNNIFPKGVTIYGRFTEIDPASGTLIAYIGA
jgi:hypothetical protein